MSSISASSSSTCVVEKKLVGGICLGSPTTTSALPRAMAPTASLVGIWEASSKMTISNLSVFKSIYWATEIGLMSIQGQSFGNKFGIWSIILRMEVPRPPLAIFRFRIPSSELFDASINIFGMRAANLLYKAFFVISWKSAVNWRYFSMTDSNNKPLNSCKDGSAFTIRTAIWWLIPLNKASAASLPDLCCSWI